MFDLETIKRMNQQAIDEAEKKKRKERNASDYGVINSTSYNSCSSSSSSSNSCSSSCDSGNSCGSGGCD